MATLCYYEASVTHLRECNLFIPAYIVDQFQGQEADLLILVTTRLRKTEPATSQQRRFLLDPQRTTVALSKAKEGSFYHWGSKSLASKGHLTPVPHEMRRHLRTGRIKHMAGEALRRIKFELSEFDLLVVMFFYCLPFIYLIYLRIL